MLTTLMIRYGEIGLKGKNRYQFEDCLISNIRHALSDLGNRKIFRSYGRVFVELKEDPREIIKRISRVFGVVSFSPARLVEADLTQIEQAAEELIVSSESRKRSTFKVNCRRADKRFPFTSPEVNRRVGAYLLKQVEGLKVDLHHPEFVVHIEIREEGAYLYKETIRGLGGLPVGSAGKAVVLLSGGIDSPVAGWMAMKRGVEPIVVHFHSFPFTSQRSKEKVLDLGRVLAGYAGRIKVHVNHFTEIQKAIRQLCPQVFYVIIMRRMMIRIAQEIAQKEGALALFTGENLGQVASQTLESILAINEVSRLPVLRPLLALDKVEIVDYAKRIGTYDISIRPYEDCCTLFVPKHPAIKPKLQRVQEAEKNLPVEELIQESLEKTEVLELTAGNGMNFF